MKIKSVNLSPEKGERKNPVESVTIDSLGVAGDAHRGHGHRQVSILSSEIIDTFAAQNSRETGPGEFGENITLEGFNIDELAVLDRISSGSVVLEVTQRGKTCHGEKCSIFSEVGKCVMPEQGIFCRVIAGGILAPGDSFDYRPRTLRIRVITLSDRASRGEYEDLSGPEIERLLDSYFADLDWRHEVDGDLITDDPDLLTERMKQAQSDGVDVIITTGGTGVGPRDITPDAVMAFCDKTVPGIMESIRVKYGAENPKALLSRSVAGVAGQTLVYCLPGSTKAVREYMTEILKTLEHLLFMLNTVDVH